MDCVTPFILHLQQQAKQSQKAEVEYSNAHGTSDLERVAYRITKSVDCRQHTGFTSRLPET